MLSDLLWQSLGLAGFLIPILLLAWSFRLLLHRPFLELVPIGPGSDILVLAALALSVLDLGVLAPPAGPGGAIGWGLQRLLAQAGARSRGIADLDGVGSSGRPPAPGDDGAVVARVARDRRRGRPGRYPARGVLGSCAEWREVAGPPAVPPPAGREHGPEPRSRRRFRQRAAWPASSPLAQPPRAAPSVGGRTRWTSATAAALSVSSPPECTAAGARQARSERERQPALDLEPDRQPVLPSLDLLAKPQAVKTEAINEEALEKNARLLETVLEDFGVRGPDRAGPSGAGRDAVRTGAGARHQGLADHRPCRRHRPLDERDLGSRRGRLRAAT